MPRAIIFIGKKYVMTIISKHMGGAFRIYT